MPGASRPTSAPSTSHDAPGAQAPVGERPRAPLRKLLPVHRITVIAKTPFLVALGMYLAGGRFAWPTVGATIVLASIMWGVLYAVNEAFDLTLEEDYIVPQQTIALLVGAVALTCIAAWFVAPALAGLFLLMTAGQLAYCMPPLRLKRWWWPVLILSGAVNPVLRAYCGAIWGPRPIPIMALLAMVLVHLGSTIRTRALQRDRDRGLRYNVSPHQLDRLDALFTILGLADGIYLCILNVFPRAFLLTAPFVLGFAAYAWSTRTKSMSKVRQGWILFAVAAIFGLVILLRGQ